MIAPGFTPLPWPFLGPLAPLVVEVELPDAAIGVIVDDPALAALPIMAAVPALVLTMESDAPAVVAGDSAPIHVEGVVALVAEAPYGLVDQLIELPDSSVSIHAEPLPVESGPFVLEMPDTFFGVSVDALNYAAGVTHITLPVGSFTLQSEAPSFVDLGNLSLAPPERVAELSAQRLVVEIAAPSHWVELSENHYLLEVMP